MGAASRSVRCRNIRGQLLKVELVDRGEFVTPGSALEQRLVVAANQQVFVQKWVSKAAGDRDPRRYDLLDKEVRAGTRLGQVFGDQYPAELARLAAYNMDAEEPFVLLHQYLGEPVVPGASRLDDGQRRLLQVGLLRALQATATAGVVHGVLTLDVVRWDGRRVQLVDFESAQRAGEPRRRVQGAPNRSPEQAAGSGEVDVRDDLWSAGHVIRTVVMGQSVDGSSDRSGDPEGLKALLDPVFGNPLERRPYPADLLRMLRAQPQVGQSTDPEIALMPGRERFDRLCASKRGVVSSPSAVADPGRSGRSVLRPFPLLAALLLIAVVVVGMVVLG